MIVDFLSQEAEQQQQPAVAPQAELEQLEAILQVAQEEGSSFRGGGGGGGGSAGYGPKLTLSVEGNISAGKSTFLQILKESGIEEHLQV